MSELSRVTLVIPKKLWEEVKRVIPAGQRSRLVVEAIEAEIRRRQRLEQLHHLRRFNDYMRDKYGEMASSVEDIEKMREERDDEVAGMR